MVVSSERKIPASDDSKVDMPLGLLGGTVEQVETLCRRQATTAQTRYAACEHSDSLIDAAHLSSHEMEVKYVDDMSTSTSDTDKNKTTNSLREHHHSS